MKKILKGIAASPGKAKGKVKIVFSIKDLPKFKEKDILVTKLTDPTMAPMMTKAGAIVTDMGGITSLLRYHLKFYQKGLPLRTGDWK